MGEGTLDFSFTHQFRYGESDLNLNNKLIILDNVYNIYDHFIEDYNNACKRYCADCCTCNLTVTTLEAYYLVENLISDNKIKMLKRLAESPQQRFRPKLTFNRIAALYAQGKDVPEEQNDPSWGKCPFLEKLECGYYQFRPFGCRCMVSKKRCSENGFAEMDPLVMTVNDVFMQFIEHLDKGGFSGNFTDVLNSLVDEKNRELYKRNELQGQSNTLISNMPIPVLLVPPEHRKKIEPFLSALNSLLVYKD
jgi:Fe-S-cluster containining protein